MKIAARVNSIIKAWRKCNITLDIDNNPFSPFNSVPQAKTLNVFDKNIINFQKTTTKQLQNIKPSQLKKILNERNDIPPEILKKIDTIDKLALYDKCIDILKQRSLSEKEIYRFFDKVYKCIKINGDEILPDVTAKLTIVPKLLKDGYDISTISRLQINNFNKNQVEKILQQEAELMQLSKSSPYNYKINVLPQIISYIDDNNSKYLKECLELTKNPEDLIFWRNDTSEILKKYCENPQKSTSILEVISRKRLSIEDVSQIAKGGKLSNKDIPLLEFKNFDKLKNIGVQDLSKLSSKDKMFLLNGFISAIHPPRNEIPLKIAYLADKMKIFKELRTSSFEDFTNDYYKTIREIIRSLDNVNSKQFFSDNKQIKSLIKDNYLKNNPIPTLVDDIKNLPYEEVVINGKLLKVVTLTSDTNLNLAIHQFSDPRSILNLEAMTKFSDQNLLLCVGLKKNQCLDNAKSALDFVKDGKKVSELHFQEGAVGIVVKPKTNFFLQGVTDIWSDESVRTRYNMVRFSKKYLNDQACSIVPELLKKELNLSQVEYKARLTKVANLKTLNKIKEIDPQLVSAIRSISRKYPLYEGVLESEIMGVAVDSKLKLNDLNQDIINFLASNDARLIRIKVKN